MSIWSVGGHMQALRRVAVGATVIAIGAATYFAVALGGMLPWLSLAIVLLLSTGLVIWADWRLLAVAVVAILGWSAYFAGSMADCNEGCFAVDVLQDALMALFAASLAMIVVMVGLADRVVREIREGRAA